MRHRKQREAAEAAQMELLLSTKRGHREPEPEPVKEPEPEPIKEPEPEPIKEPEPEPVEEPEPEVVEEEESPPSPEPVQVIYI